MAMPVDIKQLFWPAAVAAIAAAVVATVVAVGLGGLGPRAFGSELSFREYCESSTDDEIRQTVSHLLAMVATADCAAAEEKLIARRRFSFDRVAVANLLPLAAIARVRNERQLDAMRIAVWQSKAKQIINIPSHSSLTLTSNSALERISFIDAGQVKDGPLTLTIRGNPLLEGIPAIIAGFGARLRSIDLEASPLPEVLELPPALTALRSLRIAKAPKLSTVFLPAVSLSPVSPGPKPGLRRLDIQDTALQELHHLGQHGGLEELTVAGGTITHLTGLRKLERLQTIDIRRTAIADIGGLASLSHLRQVTLKSNAIQRLPSLTTSRELKRLTVREPQLTKAEGLSELNSVEYLELDAGSLSHPIAPLHFAKLRTMTLVRAANLPKLSGEGILFSLNLIDSRLTEFSGLYGLGIAANSLALEGQSTRALPEHFDKLATLHHLRLENLPPHLLAGHSLAFPKNLRSLTIARSGLARLPPNLAAYPHLLILKLMDGAIAGHLAGQQIVQKELSLLNLRGNQIESFDLSMAGRGLASIRLTGNHITDLTLSKMPKPIPKTNPREALYFWLDNNPIFDLRPIVDLVAPTKRNYILADIGVGGVEPVSAANCPLHGDNERFQALCRYLRDVQRPSFRLLCRWARNPQHKKTLAGMVAALRLSTCEDGDKLAATLTSLDLSSRGLESSWPIPVFKNLARLNLANNRIEDVSPLANLTKLEKLELAANPLGTTIEKNEANCPTGAASAAVAKWCSH